MRTISQDRFSQALNFTGSVYQAAIDLKELLAQGTMVRHCSDTAMVRHCSDSRHYGLRKTYQQQKHDLLEKNACSHCWHALGLEKKAWDRRLSLHCGKIDLARVLVFRDLHVRTPEIHGCVCRLKALHAWEKAPAARACHPREEHLLPLLVCAGAGGDDSGHKFYDDNKFMGIQVASYLFGSWPHAAPA
jgi:hypothetical protein